MASDTPRVDAAAEKGSDLGAANTWMSGIWPLARQLERELSAAQSQIAALKVDAAHFDEELQASYVPIPSKLHRDTAELVAKFAWRLAIKLRKAEQKYGYSNGWKDSGWMDECRMKLNEHIVKGDPIDVAAYCAFLMWHNERTSAPIAALHAKQPENDRR